MLRWFLRRMIARFERTFDYDASYARDVIDHAPLALLWLFLAPRVVRRPRELPLEAWIAAGLTGAMEADCGPCTQLGVRMAQQMGVADDVLAAVIAGDEDAMSDDVRLATRYTRASLRHDLDADGFRDEIIRRWGLKALARLGYFITVSGLFPTIKYALGHGQACTRVRVGGRDIVVNRLVPQEVV
jgi:hypothetical protein